MPQQRHVRDVDDGDAPGRLLAQSRHDAGVVVDLAPVLQAPLRGPVLIRRPRVLHETPDQQHTYKYQPVVTLVDLLVRATITLIIIKISSITLQTNAGTYTYHYKSKKKNC